MAYYLTTLFEDKLQRANENPLSDGGKWGAAGAFPPLELVSNAAQQSALSGSGSLYTGSVPADCFIQATIGNISTAGEPGDIFLELALRATTDLATTFIAFLFTKLEGFIIEEMQNGSVLQESILALSIASGDALTAIVQGANWYVLKNGVQVLTGTLKGVLTAGNAGAVIITNASLSNLTVTDFQVGSVSATPPTPPPSEPPGGFYQQPSRQLPGYAPRSAPKPVPARHHIPYFRNTKWSK